MTFPRVSISGTFILAIYMSTIKVMFGNSLYSDSLRSGKLLSSSIFLNSMMMTSSLLNVTSHSAVVLGALNDTYVLSILLGVGFDVMTRILQFIWWTHITIIVFRKDQSNEGRFFDNYQTIGFIFTLVVIYIYHMIIHVRALRMKKSYKRLKKVLDGALNNLRGVPGEGYHDHLFAYSDLGGHILPLSLSTILLRRQHALAVTFQMLVMLILLLYFTLSRIPLHDMEDSEPMIRIDYRGNKVTCRCEACDRQGRRNGKECSFTINSEDGICQLWLCSFEGLSTFLRSTDIKKG